MTVPSQALPSIGQLNSSEDPKVRNVLLELQTILNGGVDAANLAAAAATSAKLAPTIGLTNALVNSNSGGGTAYVDVNTMTFTPAVAGRSIFLAVVMASVAMVTGGTTTLNMKLVVDGADQAFIPSNLMTNSGTSTPSFAATVAGLWVPSLTAGAHTVKTQVQCATSGFASYMSAFLVRLELGN